METWFYLDKQNQRKEAREDELGALANSGEISPKTLTWKKGMAEWKPASETLSELFEDVGAAAPPPLPSGVTVGPNPGQKCHEVDYELFGDDMQIVEVELDPGETVIAEAGAMNYVEQDITFEAKMGDGSEANEGLMGKLMAVGKRALTGESIFMTHFTHRGGSGKRRVSFAAPYPGKIIPLDLAEVGGQITCQKDAFLCAAYGTKVSIAFNRKLGTGFFGGEGFIMQKLEGDGMAFMHAGGTVIRRELKGETLRVDTGCLVALSPGIDYGIERAGNLKSMFFGGEGMFLATLQGHGTVWLQSLPFSRMADRIIKSAPSAGGSRQGEGSVLGALGGLLDGDN
ncbi:MAG: TIGR00266 family protein [Verrucomicrobiota bacterium JB023]|nr:TIGR00266 family protein [Verrucomicrobiota bacterium JB023]